MSGEKVSLRSLSRYEYQKARVHPQGPGEFYNKLGEVGVYFFNFSQLVEKVQSSMTTKEKINNRIFV